MPHQPEASLSFSEYELQVLATFGTHAMEAGALHPDMYAVATGVIDKVNGARAELVILRRRLAINRAADGTTNDTTVTVTSVRKPAAGGEPGP